MIKQFRFQGREVANHDFIFSMEIPDDASEEEQLRLASSMAEDIAWEHVTWDNEWIKFDVTEEEHEQAK